MFLRSCDDSVSQPSFIGEGASGIRDSSFHSIMKCNVDGREDLYATIVLTDGTEFRVGTRVKFSCATPVDKKIDVITWFSRQPSQCTRVHVWQTRLHRPRPSSLICLRQRVAEFFG